MTVRTILGHRPWTYVLRSRASQDRSARSDTAFLFPVYLARAADMLDNFGIAAVVYAAGSGNVYVQLIAGVDIDGGHTRDGDFNLARAQIVCIDPAGAGR